MPDYKAMYFSLFNTLTDVIEQLKVAQKQGEQMFIDADEEETVKPSESNTVE